MSRHPPALDTHCRLRQWPQRSHINGMQYSEMDPTGHSLQDDGEKGKQGNFWKVSSLVCHLQICLITFHYLRIHCLHCQAVHQCQNLQCVGREQGPTMSQVHHEGDLHRCIPGIHPAESAPLAYILVQVLSVESTWHSTEETP